MSGLAFVCPGQGSEEPEMGLALAASSPRAARLLALASDAVGHDIARAIERGGRVLGRTDVLQPAIVAVSLGAARALDERGIVPALVLGHSLGELTAAAIATALPDELAIELAVARGKAMHAAALASPGAMCALRSGSARTLDDAVGIALGEGATLATENAPDERVVSGPTEVIRAVLRRLGTVASPLRTVGAWHSAAMLPARATLGPIFERAFAGRTLRHRFVSAASATELEGGLAIADVLARGLTEPVRFVDALDAAAGAGIDRAHVLPPARTLRTLVRRAPSRLVVDETT